MFRLFNKIMQALIFLSFYSLLTVCIYAQLKQIDLQNSIRYNEKTNLPIAIYNVNSHQYSGKPEEIARQYLLENKTLFKLKDNLDDIQITKVKQSPAGYHVGFIQNYKSIPVMRSETVVSINRQNRISMVVNGYKPNISVNTNPGVNKEQALQLAKQAVGAINSKEVFPSKTELMVYEDSLNVFHLVWKFIISPLEQGGEWLVVVDVHSGKILEKFNTLFDYVNGKGRVFDPDPSTYLNNASLTDQNDADYPALQPAYKNSVTLNDLNDAVGGVYKVQGRYAWSMDIRYPNDAIVTVTNPDNFNYNRSQNGFEEVNCYYFLDKQRRYIGSLGFNPTWDYVTTNPQAIAFDARGTYDRNAYYSPTLEYIYMGVPTSYVDAGEDQSVILHEYGHAFHDALMYGGTDNADDESDTRGVSEGIADYLGIGYRRTTQTSPFRPNYRSNWFYPEVGESILPPSSAKYPDHWDRYDPYLKMKVWASTLMDIEYNVATDPSAGIRLGRDITTKLMLTSLFYVTANSSVLDNVYAIFQADRDIPEYNGTHLNVLASVFENRGFFYYNRVYGNITINTTWSGYELVIGDVTVNPGVTLTIQPGTFIFFSSGTKLIINGTLNANGTSSNKIIFDFMAQNSSTQNGIKVNNGGNATISNAIIKNAWRGVYIADNRPSVTNSEFIDCYYGIYFYNTNYGGYNQSYITDNIIHGSYIGIVMYTSSPYITGNTIYNNWIAVGCAENSNAYLGYAGSFGNNNIHDNTYGLYAYDYSDPFLGRNTCTIQGGNNIIINSTYYHAYLRNYCDVTAENNWWGSDPPDANKFALADPPYGPSTIDYDPWLTSPPSLDFAVKDRSASPEEKIFNSSFNYFTNNEVINHFNINSPKENIFNDSSYNYDPNWPLRWKLYYVRNLIDVKKVKFAQRVCKEIITENPDSVLSISALNLLWRASANDDKDSLVGFLNQITNAQHKNDLSGIASLLLAHYPLDNDVIGSLNNTINIYKKNKNIVLSAMFKKFLYYLNYKQDYNSARAVLSEIDRYFPNSPISEDAHRQLGDNVYSFGKLYADNKKESDASNETLSSLPKEYALLGNYPNPFNPITTISYNLPRKSDVELVIYSMLGKEIKSFSISSQTAGTQNIVWDGIDKNGHQVSSGIYIYRLRAKSLEGKMEMFENSSKFILMK